MRKLLLNVTYMKGPFCDIGLSWRRDRCHLKLIMIEVVLRVNI